jgi:hypothetical protein
MNPNESVLYSRRIILRILDVVLGIVELLLAGRFFLRLLGANGSSGFMAWLYGVTDQLLGPFSGTFPTVSLSGNYMIEFSTLFAMLIYAFIGWVIIRLVAFAIDSVLRVDSWF